ncbi:MAG TPA: helicase-related protein [Spirochaetota bacterium]|nr:helicase-related protein [Spirochaetota bacterium]HPR49532.1 helicase-related protein [Spirochaetota bacterium]
MPGIQEIMNLSNKNDSSLSRFFSGGGAALGTIRASIGEASVVRIATAYFEPAGYECLRDVLRGKEVRLLLGRPDTGADKISEVIAEFFESLATVPFDDRTRAMEELRDAVRSGRFLVSVSADDGPTSIDPRYIYHHAKLYIADERSVVVTSANFTRHGLVTSREAGIAVIDSDDVAFFVERFDYYYNKAICIAEELLERLDQWLRIYRPFDIYIRSLIELYGLPDDEDPGTLPQLAGYQRPVVSRLLRNIEEFGGAMLVASTGLGKTIMAAHAVAYLRMKNRIDAAIVLCPAGLKKMWQRTMRAARLSSIEFSYYILSVEDWRQYRDIAELEGELRRANSKTIIILDESHHLRNSQEGAEIRLRNKRIIDAVSKEAKILLMTATPYSRGIDDINNQLALLPPKGTEKTLMDESIGIPWRVGGAGELSEISPGVVLTSPTVVTHFSYRDTSNERFVLFSGDQKRYFPRVIHMKNMEYNNPCDGMMIDLLKSGLLNRRSSTGENLSLFGDYLSGDRDPLFEARVVHQFCSSMKQADELLAKMELEDGFKKMRFENQDKLTRATSDMRREIAPYIDTDTAVIEDKIAKLIDIIKSHGDEKIVVFCFYIETARYITETIGRLIPERVAAHTVDKSDDIEELIRKFAPVANSIDIQGDDDTEGEPDGKEIDILVATTAMSEGFNFQDASVMINFDLPWTVLVLAQRMGRILRPWKVPREIYVYNLIPSTMSNRHIHHALNWQNRLVAKNREMRSFADIPVMVEKKGEAFEMTELARCMQSFGDADLELDEVMQFIENSDHLSTSNFIDDLASIQDHELKKYLRLPDGIRSYKKAAVKEPNLYILFSSKTRLYPAIFNRHGRIVLNSNHVDEIMQVIRSLPDEETCHNLVDPFELDSWVEKSRNEWAARNNYIPELLTIKCLMVLFP